MKTIVLSNRAQSYLKLKAHNKAWDDANAALERDPHHLKSLGRRGTASFYLKKFKDAYSDFMKVIELDPENKGFMEYLKSCEERLLQIKREAYERMKRRVVFGDVAEEEFGKVATRIPVTELHLDIERSEELVKSKEEVV